MTSPLHPLLVRLLRKAGATRDDAPSNESWTTVLATISRTLHDADQDRYTIERAMDVLSIEMQGLYRELERKTEQELAALRLSDARHRLLFQGNPLPIWVIDAETLGFLAINDAMIRTYGHTNDEFLGMTIRDLQDDVSDLVIAFDAVHHVGVRKHRCKDGRSIDMDITVHVITFDGQRAILGIGLDTTRARQLEEDLRQAQKMDAIGQLAGGVAHDFNNIIGAVLANAEFGLEELAPTAPGAEQFVEIKAAAERAAGLTRQLLTFSRKQKRQLRPLALNTVVTGVEAMLTRIVGEDITMSARIAPDLGTIEADRGEVEQVLMNLVVNARDAMPKGGVLALKTANVNVGEHEASRLGVVPGRYVVLTVSDTGCGIPPEVQSRIFEPFFTTKDVDRGTGLGLATVFGIVTQSGGGIDVTSKVESGTRFRVYWPRIDAAVSPTLAPAFVAEQGTETVLLVEDDQQLRQVLRRRLTSWGYNLLEASNGNIALDVARGYSGRIDLVLTDLVMPGLDGRSLSEQVLVERPEAKVVFMSGYTEHPMIKNAAFGPDELLLQKPFSAQKLSETLRHALAQR